MTRLLLLAALWSSAANAATFTVDTTDNGNLSGCTAAAADCSYNGAVTRANNAAGTDVIAFDIPLSEPGCTAGTGVCRIQFASGPVTVLGPVTVDGYTQPGASANTLTPDQGGSNAQLKIELVGCASCGFGLLCSAPVTLRGLAIGGFSGAAGVWLDGNTANGSVVEGNFIGTDASGAVALPNLNGINASGNPFAGAQPQNLRIGGALPAQRNLISGNNNNGIDSNGTGLQIFGNLIGTNAAGTVALPNQQVGVFIAGCGNGSGNNARVGGLNIGERNVISGNGSHGVQIGNPNGGCGNTVGALIRGNYIGAAVNGTGLIGNGLQDLAARANVLLRTGGSAGAPNVVGGSEAGAGNLIVGRVGPGVGLPREAFAAAFGNRSRDHLKLGIDGAASGVRDPNDVGDADTNFPDASGRNQNFPVISAYSVAGGNANISYMVDSAPANSVYPLHVDFYQAAGDEGGEYLGSDTYSAAEAQTVKAIVLPIPPGLNLSADDVIVATATDADFNNSEFSFHPASLSVAAASGSATLPLTFTATVTALSGPFKPNGRVGFSIDSNPVQSCSGFLVATATENVSRASCTLTPTTAGNFTLTAALITTESAFGSAAGADVVATASAQVGSAPLVVDTTSDNNLTACTSAPGDCSLRGAIATANATGAQDTIAFAIPPGDPGCDAGSGVCTITPAPGSSRVITQPLVIDGYTQPGAVPNSNSPAQGGLNGTLKIQLDGNNGGNTGLTLSSSTPSIVRGLIINRFNSRAAIQIDSTAAHRIEGNYIGTDPSGTLARPNNEFGILVNGQGGAYVIGGLTPDTRNLISGNQIDGLHFQTGFQGGPSDGMRIQGNLIGTTASGLAPLLNGSVAGGGRGIVLVTAGGGAQNILVGGSDPAARNVIVAVSSDNTIYVEQLTASGPGFLGSRIEGNLLGLDVAGTTILGNSRVFVRSEVRGLTIGGTSAGTGNVFAGGALGIDLSGQAQVLGNSMRSHSGLGISLASGARLLNDPGDADVRRQNFPDISAYAVGGGNLSMSYRVDSSVANSAYPLRVEFFKADGDEGRDFIGADSYQAAQAQTVKPISLPIPPGLTLSADDVIVATATDANGNTSEFSFALIQSLAILSDSPDPSPAGTDYSVSVRAESAGTPFKPNGAVQISDGRGGSCAATLVPTTTANRSEGSCTLSTTGAPGSITLSASYSTFASAFGTADGASIAAATTSHQIIPGVVALDAVAGNNQYASVGGSFVEALRVRVLGDGGEPFVGATVQFSAPVSGASVNLSALSAVSDADGFAQVLATANGTAGRYAVTARIGAFTQLFILNNDSALGSRCTAARSSTLGFRDDFAGGAIDPARWTVDANDGSVSVASGEATVNAGNVVGFPYVTANAGPLPSNGAFALRWIATYTSTSAVYGNNSLVASTGLAPDGGPAGNIIFHAFAGQYPAGYIADTRISTTDAGPSAFISNPPALVRREIEFCWLDGRDELWVDGVRVENPVREATLPRPDALWFGNFDRGLLPGEHPDFRLDLVEVRQLEVGYNTDLQIVSNTPNPSTPGQSVLVSVALNPEVGAPGAPSGSVPVRASTGESCTIVLPATSCSLSFATVGERIIEASYAGDDLFRTSKSAQRSQRVQNPPSLRIGDVAIAEGDSGTSALTFTVTLDSPTGAAVSVQYATAPDTATSPADFAAASGTLNFSGSTSTQPIVVQIVGDTTVEPTERFFVNLSAASGASIADTQAIGTITNDDAAPPPVISIANAAQVSEPANGVLGRFARFVVSLDRPATAPVSATLDVQSGTALAGLDFADQQSAEIVFEPGGPLSLNFDVAIQEDAIDEANEDFSVVLSAPSGATLGNAQGNAVIIDGSNATLQVNSSADGDDGLCSPSPGGCTLREAIIAANSAGGRALISFAIPGGGVQTIRPLSPLPTITARTVEINGYTQAGAAPNTATINSALNSVITVELDGGLAGASNGLKLCGAATVRGLAIGGFPQAAILAGCDGNYNPPIRIYGNFIGTTADGITPRGNGRGIIAFPRTDGGAPVITDAELDIGGALPAQRNLISASTQTEPAVQVTAFSRFLAVRIQGNLIGTDRSGVRALGNAGAGIELRHPRRACLVASVIDSNVIGANRGDGLRIVNGNLFSVPAACTATLAEYDVHVSNRIGVGADLLTALPNTGAAVRVIDIDAPFRSGNTGFYIVSNFLQVASGAAVVVEGALSRVQVSGNQYIGATLPIDLAANGPSPNDPGDIDSGPNNLLNTPVVVSAGVDLVAREVDIGYTLDTPIAAERKLVISVYGEDDSGIARYIGSAPVTTASGTVSVRLSDRLDAGDRVRLGLSAEDDGSSELSANTVTVSGALPQVSANRRRENAGQPLVFTVSLSGAPAQPVSLSYATADGSANAGSDYTASSGSISLSAATPSATINVPVVNDGLLENPETVVLNVSPTLAGSGVASARGEAVIEDDDVLVRDEGQYDTVFLSDLDGRNGTRIVMQPSNWLRVAGRGDFNGDGAPDLAIGSTQFYAPDSGFGSGAGVLHLLTNLAPPFAAQIVVPPAGAIGMARLDGVARDAAGTMLDMADLRGDGLVDVLIAVPGRGIVSPVSGGNRVAGGMSIVNGRPTPLAAAGALAGTVGVDTIAGVAGSVAAQTFSRAGYTVSAIGDVNGDGRQDLALSSPAVGGASRGELHLVFGRNAATPMPANLGANAGGVVLIGGDFAQLGLDVRGIGDFDNDGIDDLAVVSRTRVYVIRGRASFGNGGGIDNLPAVIRIDGVAPASFSANPLSGGRGHGVLSRGGDIDADGFDDFVVTQGGNASTSDRRTRAYIVYGSAVTGGAFTLPVVGSRQTTEMRAEWAEDSHSPSADILPDFNGDGRADVVLGASGADEFGASAGTVYVIYGRSGLPAVIDLFDRSAGLVRRIEGPALARAGAEVRAVADFQGDGLGDLAITAPGSGSVYLLFSNNRVFNGSLEARAPTRTAVPRFDVGRATAAQLIAVHAPADTANGRLIASVGDINGDGRSDVLRDANPFSLTSTPPRPQFTVAFGAANGPLPADSALNGRNGFSLVGAGGNTYAVAVTGGGDVDGDGKQDLVVTLNDGSASLVYGRSTLVRGFPASIDSAQSAVGVTRFGFSDNLRQIKQLRLVGDINGDGRSDLLAVSCGGVNGCVNTSNGWRADLIYGRATRATFTVDALATPSARVVIASADGRVLSLVGEADVGDIGGDTRPDFTIRLAGGDDAIIFGSSSLPASIDPGALNGANGFRITGAARVLSRLGRFTGSSRDDLAIVLTNLGVPGSAGAVQVYRGRAGNVAASINPLLLGPATLGPRFLGTPAIPVSADIAAFRAGRVAVAANLGGDAALELLIGSADAEGRSPSAGVAVIVPGLGSAWTNSNFTLDYADTLATRVITGEGVSFADKVFALSPLGDWDGDGKPEIAVNDDTIIRGAALQ